MKISYLIKTVLICCFLLTFSINSFAVQSDSLEARSFLSDAYESIQYKDIDTAFDQLDSALVLDPTLSEAYAVRGQLSRMALDIEGAFKDFDNAVKYNPDDLESRFQRADLNFIYKKYEESWKDLCYIIEREKSEVAAFLARAKCGYALRKYDIVFSDIREAEKLSLYTTQSSGILEMINKWPDAANDVENQIYGKLNINVQDILMRNQGDSLWTALQQMNQDVPNNVMVNYRIAELLKLSGNYREAIPWIEKCIEIYPLMSGFYTFIGELHFYIGDYENAIKDALNGQVCDPTADFFVELNIKSNMQLQFWEEALKISKKEEYNWATYQAREARANIYFALDSLYQGQWELRLAASEAPEGAEKDRLWTTYVKNALEQEEYIAAYTALNQWGEKGIALIPQLEEQVGGWATKLYEQAVKALAEDNIYLAKGILEKLFEMESQTQVPWMNINFLMGQCLEKLNKKDKAIEYFKTAQTQGHPDAAAALKRLE